MAIDRIEVRGLPPELFKRNKLIIEEVARPGGIIRVMLPPRLSLADLSPGAGPIPEERGRGEVATMACRVWVEGEETRLIVEPAGENDREAIARWARVREEKAHG